MFTKVSPVSVLSAAEQMKILVSKVVEELTIHTSNIATVLPAAADEGSLLASNFADSQGSGIVSTVSRGYEHLDRAAAGLNRIGSDYLNDDTLASGLI